ncbi:hypothetical protein MKW92_040181 [Papaver armeniacum]|nr:hypothetical protein MKW92_040181 [Papaver armeniacum]
MGCARMSSLGLDNHYLAYAIGMRCFVSTASVIFIILQNSFMIILVGFEKLIAHGRIGVTGKVCLGIICLLLMSILIHFALVIQTVVYFICKSYHHENIDKSCLGEHLKAYNLGDYVPLIRNKDIKLEQYEVLIESTP